MRERVLLDVFGHGHVVECDDLEGVKANAGGGDGVSQELYLRGANLGFGGRKIEVVPPQGFEEGADGGDVGHGVRVDNYDGVEVGGYAVEAP